MKSLLGLFLITGTLNVFAQTKENFEVFMFNFASNKEFQLERIKFPLPYIT